MYSTCIRKPQILNAHVFEFCVTAIVYITIKITLFLHKFSISRVSFTLSTSGFKLFMMDKQKFQLTSLEEVDKVAVENLREYIQIPSAHPNPDYEPCVKFLQKLSQDIGLDFKVYRLYPTKPVVIISWIGKEPGLQSIMLNSHTDVVSSVAENWTYDPYGAHIDDEGNMYGRGTQDTKVHGIQYLEAIRKLKRQGQVTKRTVHLSFVPDEETGGEEGMKSFVESQYFKDMNVAFALDEGMPGSGNVHWACNSERMSWNFSVHIPGAPGHGSLLLDNTAGEKLNYLLNKIYEFRKLERPKAVDAKSLGMATTVNVTMLKGGVQNNVIPSELIISVDSRIPPEVGMEAFQNQFRRWCKEAGDGLWIEEIFKDDSVQSTPTDCTNPYWMAFKGALEGMNLKVDVFTLYGAVDAIFLRKAGVGVIDYSPNQGTPMRFHSDNEFVNVNVFLKGIDVYTKIIPALANV